LETWLLAEEPIEDSIASSRFVSDKGRDAAGRFKEIGSPRDGCSTFNL